MIDRIHPDVHLDRTHAQAVCHGVAERLRDSLKSDWAPASSRLDELFDRLHEIDAETSPSIVPSSREIF